MDQRIEEDFRCWLSIKTCSSYQEKIKNVIEYAISYPDTMREHIINGLFPLVTINRESDEDKLLTFLVDKEMLIQDDESFLRHLLEEFLKKEYGLVCGPSLNEFLEDMTKKSLLLLESMKTFRRDDVFTPEEKRLFLEVAKKWDGETPLVGPYPPIVLESDTALRNRWFKWLVDNDCLNGDFGEKSLPFFEKEVETRGATERIPQLLSQVKNKIPLVVEALPSFRKGEIMTPEEANIFLEITRDWDGETPLVGPYPRSSSEGACGPTEAPISPDDGVCGSIGDTFPEERVIGSFLEPVMSVSLDAFKWSGAVSSQERVVGPFMKFSSPEERVVGPFINPDSAESE